MQVLNALIGQLQGLAQRGPVLIMLGQERFISTSDYDHNADFSRQFLFTPKRPIG